MTHLASHWNHAGSNGCDSHAGGVLHEQPRVGRSHVVAGLVPRLAAEALVVVVLPRVNVMMETASKSLEFGPMRADL